MRDDLSLVIDEKSKVYCKTISYNPPYIDSYVSFYLRDNDKLAVLYLPPATRALQLFSGDVGLPLMELLAAAGAAVGGGVVLVTSSPLTAPQLPVSPPAPAPSSSSNSHPNSMGDISLCIHGRDTPAAVGECGYTRPPSRLRLPGRLPRTDGKDWRQARPSTAHSQPTVVINGILTVDDESSFPSVCGDSVPPLTLPHYRSTSLSHFPSKNVPT
ncbi:hypothetical protein J6590_028623 [Homalodisca vitripennis]|nr:hypothetical protein J6590_028623 [Homalodisca vitripennis]